MFRKQRATIASPREYNESFTERKTQESVVSPLQYKVGKSPKRVVNSKPKLKTENELRSEESKLMTMANPTWTKKITERNHNDIRITERHKTKMKVKNLLYESMMKKTEDEIKKTFRMHPLDIES